MVSALVSYRRPFGNPLTYGWIKRAFTFLTGPNHSAFYRYQAVGEGILKTGEPSALLTFQKPIALIGLLESFINAIIGKRWI